MRLTDERGLAASDAIDCTSSLLATIRPPTVSSDPVLSTDRMAPPCDLRPFLRSPMHGCAMCWTESARIRSPSYASCFRGKCVHPRRKASPSAVAILGIVPTEAGAGGGNRTRVLSLEGSSLTIRGRPLADDASNPDPSRVPTRTSGVAQLAGGHYVCCTEADVTPGMVQEYWGGKRQFGWQANAIGLRALPRLRRPTANRAKHCSDRAGSWRPSVTCVSRAGHPSGSSRRGVPCIARGRKGHSVMERPANGRGRWPRMSEPRLTTLRRTAHG